MALPVSHQARYWGIAAVIFLVTLYLLGDVILPFILGGAIAYLLDPIADRLERLGLSRVGSVIVITIGVILIFTILLLAVVPLLLDQIPRAVGAIRTFLDDPQGRLASSYPAFFGEDGRFADFLAPDGAAAEYFQQIGEAIQSRAGQLLNGLAGAAGGFVNILVLFVLVPFITFYLLLDWDRMVARIDELLPRDHAPTIRQIFADIDKTLAGFLRGQGLVCVILGIYYAIALALVGLNFGVLIGLLAGFISFIPYVGAIVGGVLAIGVALFQFWGEWWWIVAVWAIFQSGQFVEGNILTPNLVGSSVGLHPVWLIFALSVFGALFGFVGLLVAVPVAAMIGVVARFAIDRYKSSKLYWGFSPPDRVPEPSEEPVQAEIQPPDETA
ncbi:AI-2E family transporter [Aestuariibius insulae]|uniref:AI-2E family transporter n=1 Tax=Aestuariibius insulae TaxID=2058287 RepID=UPI00345E9F49